MNSIFKNRFFLSAFMLIVLIGVYPNIYLLAYISTMPKMVFRCICFMILGLLYIKQIINRKKIDIIFVLCLLFSFYQIFITIINHEDIKSVVYSNLLIAMSCLIITNVFITINKNLYVVISFLYFFLMTIMNVISGFFLNEKNITTNWFYGNRNDIFKYFMPLIFFTYLLIENVKVLQTNNASVKKHFNKSTVLLLFVFCITLIPAIYCGSLSTSIILVVYMLYLFLFLNKNIKKFNIYCYLLIVLFVFIFFVLPGTHNSILTSILPLLGKSKTASRRLIIYDEIINAIVSGNYFFGHGFFKIEHYYTLLSTGNGHGHSSYLELMFRYGIVGVIFSIFIFVLYIKIIKKSKNIFMKNLSQFSIFMIMLWSVANTMFYFQCLYFLGLYTYFIGKYEFDLINFKINYIKCEQYMGDIL